MKRPLLLLLSMLAFGNMASAQDFSFGFKGGMNLNSVDGPAETTADAAESFGRRTGIHFGATFAWEATDLMGLRGEFMYSQRGFNRDFDGQSYYHFFTADNEIIRAVGIRSQSMSVSNSYLELPIMAYYKPFSRFEIYGGGSVAFLVASSAFGNVVFTGSDPQTPEIDHELDFNYLSDKPRKADYAEPAETVKIGSQNVPYPQSAGAYFEFVEDRGNLYRTVDFGLVGGLSFYFSRTLYLSGRINYGMVDITKSKADVSLTALNNGEFIARDDNDRNRSIQVSLGFSF